MRVWLMRFRYLRVTSSAVLFLRGLTATRRIGLAAVALAGASAAAAASVVSPEPIIEPYGQIFPALELALAQQLDTPQQLDAQSASALPSAPAQSNVLGEQSGLIGIAVVASTARESVRLAIEAPPWLQRSELTVVLPRAGQRYEIYPRLRWNFSKLRTVTQRFELPIRYSIRRGKAPEQILVRTARVRATSEALYGVRYTTADEDLDLNWLFAAYVNENSPVVEQVLAAGMETGLVEQFDGYAQQDPEQVYAQVFALWHSLQRRGIRYSNLNPKTAVDPKLFSQKVRFVEDSWQAQQANCVDGSVLLASVLQQIGIRSVLVVLPGHMLLGFYPDSQLPTADAEPGKLKFLETTLLGEVKISSGAKGMRRSLANFEAALEEGERQVHAAGDKFAEARNFSYQMIDVQAARERGVQPIR